MNPSVRTRLQEVGGWDMCDALTPSSSNPAGQGFAGSHAPTPGGLHPPLHSYEPFSTNETAGEVQSYEPFRTNETPHPNLPTLQGKDAIGRTPLNLAASKL